MLQNEMNREAEARQAEEGDDYDPYAPTELNDEDIVYYYDEIMNQKISDKNIYDEG